MICRKLVFTLSLLCYIFLSPRAVYAQAPNISYPGPQVFTLNQTIIALAPQNTGGNIPSSAYGQVTTFAGSGASGASDGLGAAASFNDPRRLVADNGGNIYVADLGNNLVRKITPNGAVSTLSVKGGNFNGIDGITIDPNGNIYLTNEGNNGIDQITPFGNVSTIAGSGSYGKINGPGKSATFNYPIGIAMDHAGNIYVADYQNQLIRKIDPLYNVTTLAGSGLIGAINGPGATASFSYPNGVGVDASGNVYVADGSNKMVRKISPSGTVTTFAGATAGTFGDPQHVVVDAMNDVYVTDGLKNQVMKITPSGQVSVVAGSGTSGKADGIGSAASFNGPVGITIGSDGYLYVADSFNDLIRKISVFGYTIDKPLPAGLVFDQGTGLISGTPSALSPSTNYTITAYNAFGSATTIVNITVNNPVAKGPGMQLPPIISYSSPQTYLLNQPIKQLSPFNSGGAVPPNIYGQVITFAGTGGAGAVNGSGRSASFSAPLGLGCDPNGDVFVGDYNNNLIREITPALAVTTYAGVFGSYGSKNGQRTKATFTLPQGVAMDKNGNLYIADSDDQLIRQITSLGLVSTFAGQAGVTGYANGKNATFNSPSGVAVDNLGNVYVADQGNNLVRKITPDGTVSVFAGTPGVTGSQNGTNATFNRPTGIAFDNSSGNIFVADAGNDLIRMITPAGLVSTFAGSGAAGAADGQGLAASFNNPTGIAVDYSGVKYIADEHNNIVRKITPDGNVTTLAGSGMPGSTDGTFRGASFSYPESIAADQLGNVYVGDVSTFLIRRITVTGYTIDKPLPAGLTFDPTTGIITGTPTALSPATNYTITAYNSLGSSSTVVNIAVDAVAPIIGAPIISYQSPQTYTTGQGIAMLSPRNTGGAVPVSTYGQVATLAGSGQVGSADGTGSAATFHYPLGIATDSQGNIYVSDQGNSLIRKITPAGAVTTLAGNGTRGNANGNGVAASFYDPYGIAVDAAGNIYVADEGNNLIRKITPAGMVSTFAGSGSVGASNGNGTAATFNHPYGVAVDASGNVYVAEGANNLIRKISPAGNVSTFAGSGTKGATDGAGTSATFYDPEGITVDGLGNVYVSDSGNELIRKITPAGIVSTLAGNGSIGAQDGKGITASFNYPYGITADLAGNLYVADQLGALIRKIDPSGVVSTLAGSGKQFFQNGIGSAASFNTPSGIAADAYGNIYVADSYNNEVRKITATGYTIDKQLPPGLTFDQTTGNITGTPTVASPATNYTITAYNAGGSGSTVLTITVNSRNAALQPPNITYQTPNVYTINTPITPLTPSNTGGAVPAHAYGQVTTVAGSLNAGNANGPAASATFNGLASLAFDAAGNLYASELFNNDIREITPAGIVSTFAGNGRQALANGPGNIASFFSPNQLAFDNSGNLYVADEQNQLIRKITPAGIVSSYAGTGGIGSADGTITTATLDNPVGLAIDVFGNMFIADQGNSTIRKVDQTGNLTTFAVLNGGAAPSQNYNGLFYLTTDSQGNVYYGDNDQVGSVSPAGVVANIAGNGSPAFANGAAASASFFKPDGVARGNGGYIYVSDGYNNRIRSISPAGVVTTVAGEFGAGYSDGIAATAAFSDPFGIVLDNTGNYLYVADFGNNAIRKVSVTGYTIDKSLPNGLAFDPNTGIISGTPAIATPAEIYTITAYNAAGSSTTTVSIQIVADESLAFGPILPKTPCDADFNPGAVSNNPITYTSSDPSVATIVNGDVHIMGPGTSTITANDGVAQLAQTLTVSAAVTPTISISPAPADTCAGKTMVFAAQITGGGTQPSLQWQINGLNVGTNSQEFTTSNLSAGDQVTCILTSNALCTTSNTVTSNRSVFSVDPPLSTSVTIAVSDTGLVCPGTPLTFTAATISPDAHPTYQWRVNGINAGSNQPAFTSNTLSEGDLVSCMLTSIGKCLIDPETSSNTLTIKFSARNLCTIEIPNTFTPNGDGVNDLWDITALRAYPNCSVMIFNRYGGRVYNSISYSKPWDGTSNGQKLPVGTYYYVIDLKNGKKPLAGFVTIIR